MKIKERILYTAIFICWIVITIVAGLNHEAWADEAQAWLIARDHSFFDIIFSNVLNYEGHPFLWYYIVKFFILLHLPYNYYFVIPLLFTGIGLYLLLFKSKLPDFIKIILPFTFYIFSLYPIIARNHSLVFPVLAFIAIIYKDRLQKPVIYTLLLLVLLSISAHSYVIAGILFLSYCFDTYKKYRKDRYIDKKLICCVSAAFLGFILTPLYLISPTDLVRVTRVHVPDNFLLSILEPFTDCYFKINYHNLKTYMFGAFLLSMYSVGFFAFCKTLQQKILFITLPLSVLLVMSTVYYMHWHLGYIFFCLIFLLWIFTEENKLYEEKPTLLDKIFYSLFLILLLIQLKWGILNEFLDNMYPYCGSKSAANFIIKNNLDKYDIVGIGFKSMPLQPYFPKNIYKNYKQSYWGWTRANYANQREPANLRYPVIVMDYMEQGNFTKEDVEFITHNYKIYIFNGMMFIKGRNQESNNLIICVRNDIANSINNQ